VGCWWAFGPVKIITLLIDTLLEMQRLEAELTARSLEFLNGYEQGKGSHSDWKEPSVLVLEITLDEATTLVKKYEQNAFVCNQLNHPSQLVFYT